MSSRDQSVAIAVIGVTGSGKSTFINLASGSNSPVSKSVGNCATELESSTFSLDGRSVTLIDTPGFNDATQNVLHVLKLISNSFPGLHGQGVKFAGVIYMHCITEDQIGGPSRHNFRIFRKFCGDTSLRDVLIVTNKFTREGCYAEEARRHELSRKDEFFGPAIDKGARMLCHDGSQASAHAILRHLIDRGPTIPPVQGGSCHQKTRTAHTSTSADSVRELTGQVGHHAKALGELYEGIGAATLAKDEPTRQTLHERAKDSLEKIERIRHDLEQMVTNFAAENSRLEDENRRYRKDFSMQKAEVELKVRLLDEERRARELAEAERVRVEAQLGEERTSWELQKVERDGLKNHAGPKYNNRFVRGALIFALICVSPFVFDGYAFLR